MTLLLVIPLILIFWAHFSANQYSSWRKSFLLSAIAWTSLVAIITEVLSLFNAISFNSLALIWLLITISLISILAGKFLKQNIQISVDSITKVFSRTKLGALFPLVGMGLLIVAIAGVAIIAPPNNWDSMTYHMSRVVHWIQNGSVKHYPTSILRQLDFGPLSSYLVMHLQILSGGDRFANLIQWFSMIGSVIGVSLIAKQLGADWKGQILASTFCATLPMGVLQASSTQNDYVVSFWIVCFAYFVIAIARDGIGKIGFIAAGLSLGLAVLTKATAYVYVFPFCLLLVLVTIRHYKFRAWQPIFPVFTIFFLLNIGHWLRNFAFFGTPIGTSGRINANEVFSLSAIISNVLRNISLHLATKHQPLNDWIVDIIVKIHNVLGIDVSDPRTTFLGSEFAIPGTPANQPIFLHEDFSGNPIHVLLIVLCIILFFLNTRFRQNRWFQIYLLTLSGTFFLFNLLLNWQPWGSRLHLPFFVLCSAFVGLVLSTYLEAKLMNIFVCILLLTTLPYLFYNASRPLLSVNTNFMTFSAESILKIDRSSQYFINRPGLKEPYDEAIRLASANNCKDVGLMIGGNSWEYPFWVIANQNSTQNKTQTLHFQHINVPDEAVLRESGSFRKDFVPCAIISIETEQPQQVISSGQTYEKRWMSEPLAAYFAKEQ